MLLTDSLRLEPEGEDRRQRRPSPGKCEAGATHSEQSPSTSNENFSPPHAGVEVVVGGDGFCGGAYDGADGEGDARKAE